MLSALPLSCASAALAARSHTSEDPPFDATTRTPSTVPLGPRRTSNVAFETLGVSDDFTTSRTVDATEPAAGKSSPRDLSLLFIASRMATLPALGSVRGASTLV